MKFTRHYDWGMWHLCPEDGCAIQDYERRKIERFKEESGETMQKSEAADGTTDNSPDSLTTVPMEVDTHG